MQEVRIENDFESWRDESRRLLSAHVEPSDVVFVERGMEHALLPGLLIADESTPPRLASDAAKRVPKEFVTLAKKVTCHRDPVRWNLLYRLLWRLTHGEPHVLQILTDDDVHLAFAMEKQVRFDAHKMKAFVRFRRVATDDGGEHYIAWHRPQHYVIKLSAPFFARRFANMKWSILTPLDSAYWDGQALTFGPGCDSSETPAADELEDLWRTYYANIFNPARIKLKAMRKEMPARYWATMPETQLIPDLLRDAPRRVEAMMATTREKVSDYPTAEPFLPSKLTLPQLREAAEGCKGCPLYKPATQTVFGEGAKHAQVVFVGEQPGDQEDLAGKPFVGPSGQLLDEVLEKVGIDRKTTYVTNAVKHFKFEPRGKRRIHSKPNAREIQACKPWLVAEMQVIKPPIVVALGATAAQALMGNAFRVTKERGVPRETQWAPWTMATYHPSALLRMPDEAARDRAYHEFVGDLKKVAKQLASL
jgi:DNA polymerase